MFIYFIILLFSEKNNKNKEMTMFGFCKSAPDIPIEHLDYKYIETCNDVNKLQKILQVLK